MKFTEYPEASAVASADVFMIDGQDGSRKVPANKMLEPLLKHGTATNGHRVIPECKYLGTTITAAQAQAIYDGTFEGLHVGDYWTISGHNWRIWDFDQWLNMRGNTDHHIVILPDDCLYDAKMNNTNVTTGGYVSSQMRTANLANAKTLINGIFGGLVYTHKEYLVNAVTNGRPSGYLDADCDIEIPSEIQLYGCRIFSSSMPDGSTTTTDYDTNHRQLLLAQLMPEFVNINHNTWLRDVVSAADFASLRNLGYAYYAGASAALGVRPVFGVKGRAAS